MLKEEALVRSIWEGSYQPRQSGGTAAGRVVYKRSGYVSHAYVLIGRAPGEAWRLLRGASPRRERPNQPPVSSVADTKEDVTKDRGNPLQWVAGSVRNREWPNDVSEAYTENPVGRRGDCAPQSNSASSHTEAGGDGVTNPEANTKGSLWVRSWRACRGQRAWHAGRETPGTWETPSSPSRG